MLRFLRWLFGITLPGGYRCDGCKKWTLRKTGKAFVRFREYFVRPFAHYRGRHVTHTELLCPECRPKEVPSGAAQA